MLSIQVASWHEVIVTIQTLREFSDRLNMRGQRDMDIMCQSSENTEYCVLSGLVTFPE